MTREEIKQLDYDSPYHFETEREEDWYKIGCVEGLDAADSEPDTTNIWYDTSDNPDAGKFILVMFKSGDLTSWNVRDVADMNFNFKAFNVERWAYINDLLPKGGEK